VRWIAHASQAVAGVLIGLTVAGIAQAQPQTGAPASPAVDSKSPPSSGGTPAAGAVWGNFPVMLLEKVYRGPLRDTIIQRWRDPTDGSVCFLYIPISTPLLPQPAEGYMQYGPNQIGSISCIHPTQVLQLWQGGGTAPPVPAPVSRR
jgi:hypothetical protein